MQLMVLIDIDFLACVEIKKKLNQSINQWILTKIFNIRFLFFVTAPGGTKQCQGCRGGNRYECSYQKRTQICATDFNSLGTTHCGSAILKYRRNYDGMISQSVLRGCINCAGWWNFVLTTISSEYLTRHRFKKKALRTHLYLSRQKLTKLVY